MAARKPVNQTVTAHSIKTSQVIPNFSLNFRTLEADLVDLGRASFQSFYSWPTRDLFLALH